MDNILLTSSARKHCKELRRVLLTAELREFRKQFPDELECLKFVYEKLSELPAHCRWCQSSSVIRCAARTVKCQVCLKITWFTAGTFFDNVRRFEPWVGALWFKDRGIALTAWELHKLFSTAYSTALNIARKLRLVVLGEIPSGTPTVDTGAFSVVYAQRSCDTPRRQHPLAEQELLDQDFEGDQSEWSTTPSPASTEVKVRQLNQCDSNSLVTRLDKLLDEERVLFNALAPDGSDVDELTDSLTMSVGVIGSALTGLELAGLVERVGVNRYARITNLASASGKQSKAGQLMCGNVLEQSIESVNMFITLCFKAVSRRFIGTYVAEHWFFSDKSSWPPGKLLEKCLRAETITDEEAAAYISDRCVALVPGVLPLRVA